MAFGDLLRDAVFVDYFNVFLSLPVRSVTLYYSTLTELAQLIRPPGTTVPGGLMFYC